MTSSPKQAVNSIALEVLNIGAIADILKRVAVSHISCGEVIEGTTIDWLAARLEEANDRISDTVDGL